jgi:hypothetical protein
MVKMKPGSARGGRPPAKAASPKRVAPAPDPEPVPSWTGRLQLKATPEMVDFLNRRGARPDRGRSAFNLTNVMLRQFELFMASIDESDPRGTRGFSQAYYDLTIELLVQPWTLNADSIRLLDSYLGRQPHFARFLAEAGVERAAYLKAIAELSFAERLHLVEAAQVHHAPPLADPLDV